MKIIGGLVIFFLICLPLSRNLFVRYATNHFLDFTQQEISILIEDENINFNLSAIEAFQTSDVFIGLSANLIKLGEIKIPSVGLHLPIFKGVSGPSISIGAGTMRRDQKMGIGNFPLASHYIPRSNLLFSPLHDVEIEEFIYLIDNQFRYVYQIKEIKIIKPHEIQVIEDKEEKKMITLITCTKDMENRLVVRGELISKELFD